MMRVARFVSAVSIALAGLAVSGLGCGERCDNEYLSPHVSTIQWTVTREDGAALGSGCAIAALGPGIGLGPSDIPLASDVIKFSAKPGDVVTVQVRDWEAFRSYKGLCVADPTPTVDLKDSSLFCADSAARSPAYLNACETSASSAEPAVILSNVPGDSSSQYAAIIKIRVLGAGVQHVVPHRWGGTQCEAAANPALPTFSLFTITPG